MEKVKNSTYYSRNKERMLKQQRERDSKNADYRKQRYENNKENQLQKVTEHREKHNDGQYHVYLIDNYAGYTSNVYYRMLSHKFNGKNTTNQRVIASFKTKSEAKELESFLHELGYEGKFKKTKYAS